MNEPNDDCGNTVDPTTWYASTFPTSLPHPTLSSRFQSADRLLTNVFHRQATLQGAVTAIRNAGATSQYIFLPGKHYEHAQTYTGAGGSGNGDTGSNILAITDKDGTKSKLIIDVHQYLDSDGSGQHSECTTSSVSDSNTAGGVGLQSLATWLARNGRQAILTETGGGNTASCVTYLKQQLGFLK